MNPQPALAETAITALTVLGGGGEVGLREATGPALTSRGQRKHQSGFLFQPFWRMSGSGLFRVDELRLWVGALISSKGCLAPRGRRTATATCKRSPSSHSWRRSTSHKRTLFETSTQLFKYKEQHIAASGLCHISTNGTSPSSVAPLPRVSFGWVSQGCGASPAPQIGRSAANKTT